MTNEEKRVLKRETDRARADGRYEGARTLAQVLDGARAVRFVSGAERVLYWTGDRTLVLCDVLGGSMQSRDVFALTNPGVSFAENVRPAEDEVREALQLWENELLYGGSAG